MRKSILIVIFALILTGCQGNTPPIAIPTQELVNTPIEISTITPTVALTITPTVAMTVTPTVSISPPSDKLAQNQNLWKESPHASQNIGCEACHGNAQNPGTYAAVSNAAALCSKCHPDTEILRNHADQKYAHAGLECLNCHNPHSTNASCLNSGCHENIRKPGDLPPSTPTGGHPQIGAPFCGGPNCHPAATEAAISNPTIHGAKHAAVSCIACHDATGLQVGPSDVVGSWVTFQAVETNGATSTRPFSSHSIQVVVECTRCHFEGNSWKLPLVTGHEFGN